MQTEPLNNDQADEISAAIQDAAGVDKDAISTDAIGATWGAQVAQRALLGLVVFLVLVVLFIWAYFREWKMSVGAIVALVHDLVITVGVYALSGFEVTPATVTGILTILGFSLYDTVVVFDKVRENTKNLARTRQTYAEAANLAVNQTLVRSINTSIVALLPVGALLYVGVVSLGSGALKDLALALFVGMAAGAYSSIFIATPLVVQLKELEPGVRAGDARAMRHRKRHEVDRYASVPTFTEDMPLEDEPGGPRGVPGWRPTTTSTPEETGVSAAPARTPRSTAGERPASRARVAVRVRQARAAAAQAAGRSAASGDGAPCPRASDDELQELMSKLVLDVPDFPQPGVTFKDITPLLADPDGLAAVVAALAAAGRDETAPSWWTRWSASRRAGSSSPPRSRWPLGVGFVPVRKAGKLPRESLAVSFSLEYGEATLELHQRQHRPG